ncbi:MAG: hypothetical protein LBU86_01875 [Oscillospiraceae bacterium]|jgi:type II secretory pathway pseudopilin PulG|nr:hypothetical protein [Oscillospiraceae bacterium]
MQVIRQKSKSSLFLIELLIVIAFFSVAAVVCVRLFVEARLLSASGRDLSGAMAVAQSAAECFKSAKGDPALAAGVFGSALDSEGDVFLLLNGEPAVTAELSPGSLGDTAEMLFFFDDGLRPAAGEGSFRLLISVSMENGLSVADISVSSGEEPVFSIRAASAPAGVGEAAI